MTIFWLKTLVNNFQENLIVSSSFFLWIVQGYLVFLFPSTLGFPFHHSYEISGPKLILLIFVQDGNTLPNGPVVISPDGLFPSLYREGEFSMCISLLVFPVLISS